MSGTNYVRTSLAIAALLSGANQTMLSVGECLFFFLFTSHVAFGRRKKFRACAPRLCARTFSSSCASNNQFVLCCSSSDSRLITVNAWLWHIRCMQCIRRDRPVERCRWRPQVSLKLEDSLSQQIIIQTVKAIEQSANDI